MNMQKMIGVVLLVGGILALVYGGFTYVQDKHEVDIGPVEFSVKDKETVDIPVWGGVALLVGGAVLLVGRRNA